MDIVCPEPWVCVSLSVKTSTLFSVSNMDFFVVHRHQAY